MTALLFAALEALGDDAGRREIEHVAGVLRDGADAATRVLLVAAGEDLGAWRRAVRVADAAGAGGVVLLDLVTEFSRPGVHAHLDRGGGVSVEPAVLDQSEY